MSQGYWFFLIKYYLIHLSWMYLMCSIEHIITFKLATFMMKLLLLDLHYFIFQLYRSVNGNFSTFISYSDHSLMKSLYWCLFNTKKFSFVSYRLLSLSREEFSLTYACLVWFALKLAVISFVVNYHVSIYLHKVDCYPIWTDH